MRKYKKIISILTVLLTALILQACGDNGMKYIERCIEEGEYQKAHIVVNELELKATGKLGDLIADVDNYNEVVSLLNGQSGENDLEAAKRQMLGFNGSYKKYKSFKKDVDELEKRITELEDHRAEIDEMIQKIQESDDEQDYKTMNGLITEYKANESLISDTSKEQGEKLERLIIQNERYQEEINKNGGEAAADVRYEWFGGILE